jgi:hypothetical protein
MIPLNERHLREILKGWILHYNRGRPHASVGPGIPDPSADLYLGQSNGHRIPADRRVVAAPILGGLHHEYLTRTGRVRRWEGLLSTIGGTPRVVHEHIDQRASRYPRSERAGAVERVLLPAVLDVVLFVLGPRKCHFYAAAGRAEAAGRRP